MYGFTVGDFTDDDEKNTMWDILKDFAEDQDSRYAQARSCLNLQNWYEYDDGYLEREVGIRYRVGQLKNCLELIKSTSRFEVFDNLQPYSMQRHLYQEVNYIFMGAFEDLINGDSEVIPTNEMLDFFIQYAYVIITNQVPIDLSVQNIRAVFPEHMMTVLKLIYDNFEGLTLKQSKNIEFLMEQYSNGEKVRVQAGEYQEFRAGDKLARWGRLDKNDDGTFGIELPTYRRNYAKITFPSIDSITCEGNVILDVVEQPRQFAKAYGCDNNLPYEIDDCTKELAVNVQCVEPQGEWTKITSIEIDSSKGATLQVDSDRRKCKNVVNGAVQMFYLNEVKYCYDQTGLTSKNEVFTSTHLSYFIWANKMVPEEDNSKFAAIWIIIIIFNIFMGAMLFISFLACLIKNSSDYA